LRVDGGDARDRAHALLRRTERRVLPLARAARVAAGARAGPRRITAAARQGAKRFSGGKPDRRADRAAVRDLLLPPNGGASLATARFPAGARAPGRTAGV